jgi:hypothetical protein
MENPLARTERMEKAKRKEAWCLGMAFLLASPMVAQTPLGTEKAQADCRLPTKPILEFLEARRNTSAGPSGERQLIGIGSLFVSADGAVARATHATCGPVGGDPLPFPYSSSIFCGKANRKTLKGLVAALNFLGSTPPSACYSPRLFDDDAVEVRIRWFSTSGSRLEMRASSTDRTLPQCSGTIPMVLTDILIFEGIVLHSPGRQSIDVLLDCP